MGGGGGGLQQHAQTQGGGGGGQFAPNNFVGGFMNDQTAQIGFQVGQKAMTAGQEYMEQSVYLPIPSLFPFPLPLPLHPHQNPHPLPFKTPA
jgi:hypothetical protein